MGSLNRFYLISECSVAGRMDIWKRAEDITTVYHYITIYI